MKVGDLVKCPTAGSERRPVVTGIIVEIYSGGLFGVILTHNNAMCCFQSQHLEVINASR